MKTSLIPKICVIAAFWIAIQNIPSCMSPSPRRFSNDAVETCKNKVPNATSKWVPIVCDGGTFIPAMSPFGMKRIFYSRDCEDGSKMARFLKHELVSAFDLWWGECESGEREWVLFGRLDPDVMTTKEEFQQRVEFPLETAKENMRKKEYGKALEQFRWITTSEPYLPEVLFGLEVITTKSNLHEPQTTKSERRRNLKLLRPSLRHSND